ncbi:ATP-dependent DNA helicase pif1 [Gigaspora margarita]|uniref:ATP-dependent DNA helicase pif1 n=1 Tax=Gigaspora margarita TaxID=4874 RepID=A0A8H4B2B6_GIGMA|nr:ATP-dependent DNA helicase pif1 [Gigaspora margarita]
MCFRSQSKKPIKIKKSKNKVRQKDEPKLENNHIVLSEDEQLISIESSKYEDDESLLFEISNFEKHLISLLEGSKNNNDSINISIEIEIEQELMINQQTGDIAVYLCCSQRDDCKKKVNKLALGFLTSFVNYIETNKITELIIDSTFKTNQEKFKLFAVLTNCGENAITCKIKEARFKETNYTQQKAEDAYKIFEFIDINWLPDKRTNAICPEEHKKSLLNMIRKHIVMHPLIPVKKNTFLTLLEIYYQCTLEAYNFCKQKDLKNLWGYLCTYLICKHLIAVKCTSDPTFVPLFTNTKRRHDYPLICFDNPSLSRINSINSAWNVNIDNNIEFVPEFDDVNTISSSNARHNIPKHEILEKTNEAANKYIKSMDTAIQLLKQNKNNQKFIEPFGKVGNSLIKEIDTCQEVLN